ncbi:MAG: GDP-mannose 4,6-dehydratase [Planctomycetota bacterium]
MRGPTLITGAAGFIGSHLARVLLERGESVVGVDNFDPMYDESIKRANIAAIERAAANAGDVGRFRLVTADIRNKAAMTAAYDEHEPGATIHLAARAGVRPSVADPAGYVSVNVEGTARMLEAATANGRVGDNARPFVMASSSSVYGNSKAEQFAEDEVLDRPISPYAATKRSCELVAYTFHHLYQLPIACMRLFTVYGPRQRPDLAIAKFMRLVRTGEPIPVFGDGSMARDYTYVDDIVSGLIAARERIGAHGYRIWNVGSDRPVGLNDMVAMVGNAVGVEPKIDRKPVPPGDVDRTCADLTRSRAELGYEPTTGFEQGLAAQAAAITD